MRARRGSPPSLPRCRCVVAAFGRVARHWLVGDALIPAGALAGFALGVAIFAPLVEDWRSDRRPMTSGCQVVGVVDGDTLDLACAGIGGLRARLVGYEAPELFAPRCTGELAAARRARDALEGWVMQGPRTEVAFLGSDRYGRTLVDMRLGGQRVAKAMVGAGNGRRYLGNVRRGWC
jgi:micrococcal nuclease